MSGADLLIQSKGELWTLGGGARQLKLSGRKNYTYLSWAICQRLDDSVATTKNVEIPTKEVKMEDRRQLTIFEARSLFKKRLRYMEGGVADEADQTEQSKSQFCSPADYTLRHRSSLLPTPPVSPDQQLLQLQQLQQLPKKIVILTRQHQRHLLARPWRGIFELSDPMNCKYVLRNTLIHPQQLTQSRAEIHPHPLPSTEIYSEDIDGSMNDDFSTRSNTRSSSSPPSPNPANAMDDLQGAHLLHEIWREEKEKENLRGSSDIDSGFPDDADIYLDAASPRETWEAHRPHAAENKILTEKCSESEPWCPYTRLSTKMHFHCPEEKCRISRPSSSSSRISQSQDGREGGVGQEHEHCVSRLGPYPDSAGECHLLNTQLEEFRDHRCCEWDEKDLATITVRGRRAYEMRKTEEARRMGGRVFDRRGEIWGIGVGGWLDIGRGVEVSDFVDDRGRELLEQLQTGGLDEAVRGLVCGRSRAGRVEDVDVDVMDQSDSEYDSDEDLYTDL
jgi:hypothetical protein